MDERAEEEARARSCHPGGAMLPWQHGLSVRLDAFHRRHCGAARAGPQSAAAARDIARAVSAVLLEVGAREPRFVISPAEAHHRHHHHQQQQQPHLREATADGLEGLLQVADGAPPSADFEMLLYLNLQTPSGVFSLVDGVGEGGGRALLKLADGRKRGMSLWVEFVTASGSLSARKLRCRLLALVAQALERRRPRCGGEDVRLVPSEAGEVLIGVRGRGVARVTPAFRCSGAAWPRCASQWLQQQQQGYCDESLLRRGDHQQSHHRHGHDAQESHCEESHYYRGQHQQQQLLKHHHEQIYHHRHEQQQTMTKKTHQWPGPARTAQIKAAGFTLLSAEDEPSLGKGGREQGNAKRRAHDGAAGAGDGDAWLLRFAEAEELLLEGGCRRKCLSVLAALRERHLRGALGAHDARALVLHECEKHPRDADWEEACLGERLLGALLQLVSCLRCRRCPHFFVRGANLLRGRDASELDGAAEQAWRLARLLIASPAGIDEL